MKVMGVFLVVIFLCSGVFAVSGVSPGSYEVLFEPGLSEEFVFNFVVDGSADLYIKGDLADYVSLDKKRISGSEKVVAVLNLPIEVDSPGVNYIEIDAGNVRGFIKVDVPYPNRYVDVGLNAPNVNVGESTHFELELFGRGNESVIVSPRIEIFKDGEIFDVVELEDVESASNSIGIVDVSFGTDNYSAGDYLAVAYLDYDNRSVSVENPFRLGDFSVKLVDYTKDFRDNKIENFEISVESLCDNNIVGVYAEVNILGFPDASFITSAEDLQAWRTVVLSGFLDTSLIDKNNINAEIVFYCENKTTSEVVELEIKKGFDYIFLITVLVIVLGLALLVWRSWAFVRNFEKHRIKKR